MTISARRWLWTATVLSILAAPVGFTALSTVLPSTGERAQLWASALSPSSLMAINIREFDRLSTDRQLAVFAVMQPVQRAELWRAHVAPLMSSRDIPTEAADTLRELVALSLQGSFTRLDTAKAGQLFARLRIQVAPSVYRELSQVVRSREAQSSFGVVATWLRSRLVVFAELSGKCECIPPVDGGDGCQGGLTCHSNPANNCDPQGTTCNLGWSHALCIGICGT